MNKNRPICPFKATECFAYVQNRGACKALEDTNFKLWRGCPFFKTKEQRKAELGNKDPDTEELEDFDYE